MGTNYYLKTAPDNVPAAFADLFDGEKLHIGKSSAGWCFALHVMPERGIHDLGDWRLLLELGQIENEYGDRVTVVDMLAKIRDRMWTPRHGGAPLTNEGLTVGSRYLSQEDFHRQNHSEPGSNGLLRSRLDSHCIAHGAGTWDCIVGEFS